MISREELIKSKEYWLEKTQNALFVELEEYMEKNNLNRTKFAQKLGVSKSYLTQVLNGNFDHKLSKLIELSLAVDKIPLIKFEEVNTCLLLDELDKLPIIEKYDIKVELGYSLSDFASRIEHGSQERVFEEDTETKYTTRNIFVIENKDKFFA